MVTEAPCAAGHPAPAAAAFLPEGETRVGLLLVDDSDAALAILRKVFQDYEVSLASSGEEALDSMTDDIACVVMDAKMPTMSGFEASRRIWRKFPHVPIIMHTGHDDEHNISEIVSYGFESYIVKGAPEMEMRLKVKHACEKYFYQRKEQQYKRDLEKRTSELSQALASLRETQVKLIQSERATITSRLLSSLSHRLKNPAVAIESAQPNLTQDVRWLLTTGIPWLGTQTETELQAGLAVLQAVFEQALVQRLPTSLEILQAAARLQAAAQGAGLGLKREHYSLAARHLLTAPQLQMLAELLGPLDRWLELVRVVVQVGAQLRNTGSNATQLSKEIFMVLNAAQPERAKPSDHINLNQVIGSALDMLSFRLKGIKINSQFAELPPLSGFPVDLMYCFVYLIENAIDAVGEGGEITLTTQAGSGQISAEILDNGKEGIPAALQAEIFKPFVTTKSGKKGTGLGLFDAKRIIEEGHQGSLQVRSRPGETRFVLTLPLIAHGGR